MTSRRLSYVHGAVDVPLLGETIGASLDRTVARFGDRPALIVPDQGVRWSYAELAHRADAFAAGLLALGLRKGDRVGIWSLNNAEWVIAQFATAKAGLILVNINPSYRPAELEFALSKVGVAAFITGTRFKSSDYLAMLRALVPELAGSEPGCLKSPRLLSLHTVIPIGGVEPGTIAFDDVAARAGPSHREELSPRSAQLQFDDPINIQFTSGTTGMPKGATLTHHNILNNGYFIGRAMRLSEHDRLCIPVPLYHCFGMVLGNLACTTHGAAMVYPGEGFDSAAVLRTVAAERCTGLHGVPTMFIAELEHPDFAQTDLSTLRTGIMAGSPCPIEVMRRAVDWMHLHEITICYGMTETSPVSFQSSADDTLERRVSTVGRTRTQLVIDPARWMHTGDLATIDDEGFCNIVGRLKDVMIRGGQNVYPREVEEFLYSHPKIQDVQVFGVPDPKYGEELCAWVKLRAGETLTEAELQEYCQDAIAHHKIPSCVRFVDEFPMTVTGKMQKYLMRDAMQRELGLSKALTA